MLPVTHNQHAADSSSTYHFLIDLANTFKAFIGLNFIVVAYGFSKAGLIRGIIGLVVITYITEHCCILLITVKNAVYQHSVPVDASHSYPRTDTKPDNPTPLIDDDGTPDTNIDLNSDSTTSPPPPNQTTTSTTTNNEDSVAASSSQHNPTQLQNNHPDPTFGDVAYRVGGKFAERFIIAMVILTQFGYCVGYFIFLSQTLHDVVGSTAPVPFFILAPFPILSAMALLVSIRALGPFSAFANGALLCGFVAVVTFITRHFNWTPTHVPLSSFPMFFGQITAAIEGIGLVIPLEASMRCKKDFPLVLRIALIALTLILMTVGVLGFATFGRDTRSIILLNFGASPIVVAVKIVLMVGILFTYPLQIVPVFEFAERTILGAPNMTASSPHQGSSSAGADVDDELSPQDLGKFQIMDVEDEETVQLHEQAHDPSERMFLRDRRRIAVRLGVVTLTAVTAVLAGTSFGVFNALVGSLGASMLAYTAPAILHTMAFREELSTGVKIKNGLIALFGICGAIAGTMSSLWEIVEIHRGNSTQT